MGYVRVVRRKTLKMNAPVQLERFPRTQSLDPDYIHALLRHLYGPGFAHSTYSKARRRDSG